LYALKETQSPWIQAICDLFLPNHQFWRFSLFVFINFAHLSFHFAVVCKRENNFITQLEKQMAAALYVCDTSGSDETGDGSRAKPFKNIIEGLFTLFGVFIHFSSFRQCNIMAASHGQRLWLPTKEEILFFVCLFFKVFILQVAGWEPVSGITNEKNKSYSHQRKRRRKQKAKVDEVRLKVV